MASYIGILDGGRDVWGVRIPDFPGVHGGGSTPEAAVDDAIGAVRQVTDTMAAESQDLPPARTLAEVLADKDDAPNAEAGEMAVRV